MTEANTIAIAITVLAVFAGSLFNNVRIADLNTSLTGKINDTRDLLRAELRAETGQLRNEMQLGFASIDRKLDEILRMAGDHETRITALERK